MLHCVTMFRCNKMFCNMSAVLKRHSSIYNRVRSMGKNYQVTILGGANDLGQPIGLLLRSQPFINKLVLHDVEEHTPGVILDLSHIPTDTALCGYSGSEAMTRAVINSDLVIAAGGCLRSPKVTKEEFLAINAEFIKNVARCVSKLHPLPFLGIVTEPINTMVPLAAEVMKVHGEYDARKLFGITTMDPLRAQAIYAYENDLNPRNCVVPLIGGHSEVTTVPLISQAWPKCDNMTDKVIQEFTHKVRRGGDVIVLAKRGHAATLSTAYGVLEFTRNILGAIDGTPTTVYAYVENNDLGCEFLAGMCDVDHNGVVEMRRYSNLSPLECHLLDRSLAQIRKDVAKGIQLLEIA